MDMATHLQAVCNTLEEIEVKGHANVKRMALCLDYLKELRDEELKKGETADAAVAGENEEEVAD